MLPAPTTQSLMCLQALFLSDSKEREMDVNRFVILEFDFGTYEGQVKDGTCRHGWGLLKYHSGNEYQGEWMDGAFHGQGRKRFANGDQFEGEWRQGKRNGPGKYWFANGHCYEGGYANDHCEGYGTFSTIDGDNYSGEWAAGRKHGKGVETLRCGRKFEGSWVHGRKHGEGTLTTQTGDVVKGVWESDRLVTRSEERREAAVAPPVDVDPQLLQRAGLPPELANTVSVFNNRVNHSMSTLMGGVSAMEDQLMGLQSVLDALESELGGENGEELR